MKTGFVSKLFHFLQIQPRCQNTLIITGLEEGNLLNTGLNTLGLLLLSIPFFFPSRLCSLCFQYSHYEKLATETHKPWGNVT